jgi:hypothetical protein
MHFGFLMARAATGAGAHIMLVAVTLGAGVIGVTTAQSELAVIKALDHAVLPIVAFRAGGSIYFYVGCYSIVVMLGVAGDAICFLSETAVFIAVAGLAGHLLAVIVGEMTGKAKFGQHIMIYIAESQLCQVGFLSIVLRVAGLAAGNPREPPVQRVDILALGSNLFVAILAGAVTEAMDGYVAVRTIVGKLSVGRDAAQRLTLVGGG